MLNEGYMDGMQDGVFERDLLSDATEIIEWLKGNKPVDEGEVNELIRLIVDWDTYDNAKGRRYSGARWHKSLMIYGSKEALWLHHETMRECMLDVLDGLKEELNTIECHAVGVAA